MKFASFELAMSDSYLSTTSSHSDHNSDSGTESESSKVVSDGESAPNKRKFDQPKNSIQPSKRKVSKALVCYSLTFS